jgi:hypothetical protein
VNGVFARVNLKGFKVGQLLVLGEEDRKHGRLRWRCLCGCGNQTLVTSRNLTRTDGKHTRSCGCAKLGEKRPIPRCYWGHLLANARIRKIRVTITHEQAEAVFLKQGGRCALSGKLIVFDRGYGAGVTASLDRKDSSGIYSADNVWWVHKTVNRMKMAMPVDEFIEFCAAIKDYVHDRLA